MNIGDKVWFRGRYSTRLFDLRGVIERIDRYFGIGVRLENGNFRWVAKDQLKSR